MAFFQDKDCDQRVAGERRKDKGEYKDAGGWGAAGE